jgi:hypothetical protein
VWATAVPSAARPMQAAGRKHGMLEPIVSAPKALRSEHGHPVGTVAWDDDVVICG